MAMSFDGCMASSPAPHVYGVVERRIVQPRILWPPRKTVTWYPDVYGHVDVIAF